MPNLQFPLKKSRKTAKLFLGNPSLSSQTTSAETERSSISHDPTPTFSSSSAVAGLAHFGGKPKEEERGRGRGGRRLRCSGGYGSHHQKEERRGRAHTVGGLSLFSLLSHLRTENSQCAPLIRRRHRISEERRRENPLEEGIHLLPALQGDKT